MILTIFIEYSQCQDWTPWSSALRVRSKAGQYVVEYTFFVIFSVSPTCSYPAALNLRGILGLLRNMCEHSSQGLRDLCQA